MKIKLRWPTIGFAAIIGVAAAYIWAVGPTVGSPKMVTYTLELPTQPATREELVMNEMSRQIKCLALNMYHEARNQGDDGMRAVATVTLNRVVSSDFPADICGVVYQGVHKESWRTAGQGLPMHKREFFPVLNQCQFSWYCDGKSDEIADEEAWEHAKQLAVEVLNEFSKAGVMYDEELGGATYYHASYVEPYWAADKYQVAQIGDHIFYY